MKTLNRVPIVGLLALGPLESVQGAEVANLRVDINSRKTAHSGSTDSPPVNRLRATVSTSTSAELQWERVPNRALQYEILRNDGLTNITNGSSYFDNKRLPGISNVYIVTTIDESGTRSSPVSVDVPAFQACSGFVEYDISELTM